MACHRVRHRVLRARSLRYPSETYKIVPSRSYQYTIIPPFLGSDFYSLLNMAASLDAILARNTPAPDQDADGKVPGAAFIVVNKDGIHFTYL